MSEVTHADIATMAASLREQNQVAVACRAALTLLETHCQHLLNTKRCPLCEGSLFQGMSSSDWGCTNCYDGTSGLGRYTSSYIDEQVNQSVELKLEELFTTDELKAHLNWGTD